MTFREPRCVDISVIVPCLNEAQRLPGLLTSLAEAGFAELIVVDGGSEDDSAALVASTPHARLLRAPRGRASQMNAGAYAAHGEALLFLHADARLPADAPALIREALSRPEAVAGAFTLHTVSSDGRWKPWLRVADLRSRYTRHPYGDQALFVRRAVFEAVGGFPDQALMEDLELSRRLRQEGELVRVWRDVEVSGRRFEVKPLRSALFMNLAPTLYRAGVSPETLRRLYGDVR